ncbi:MAG: hypothetical protein ACK46V_02945, partial [Phycisphaerae bacterium]
GKQVRGWRSRSIDGHGSLRRFLGLSALWGSSFAWNHGDITVERNAVFVELLPHTLGDVGDVIVALADFLERLLHRVCMP